MLVMTGFYIMEINGTVLLAEVPSSSFNLIMNGGLILAILTILLFIAIYVFTERYRSVNKAIRDDKHFMDSIRAYILNGRFDPAKELCKSTDNPTARIIEKGLSRIGKPLSEIYVAVENTGNLEVAKMEKNIAGLATIAGAAPMLGFLGTAAGLIYSFYNLSLNESNINLSILSSGIYQALFSTLAGLIVGILSFVFYNLLVSRIERLAFKLEMRASELMDLLHESET
jgi:biopolymer transport protein ExbB